MSQPSLRDFAETSLLGHSPLFWVGIPALLLRGFPRWARAVGLLLLVVQASIITFLVQVDLRFLAGIPVGLAVAGASYTPESLWKALGSRRGMVLSCGLLLAPWLAVQCYYARPFLAVSVGLRSRTEFLMMYTAFRTDFLRLHELLPGDAVLLLPALRLDAPDSTRPIFFDFHLDSVYAPRPIVFHVADLPPGRPVFLMALGAQEPTRPPGIDWVSFATRMSARQLPSTDVRIGLPPGCA